MVADLPPALMQSKRSKMRNIEWKTVEGQKRSADSGIFSRSISEKNDDSSTLTDSIDSRLGSITIVNNKSDTDCDMQTKGSFNSGSDNNKTTTSGNNKHLTKKSSKDSGIDCRTKSDSISSDAAKEFLQSTNHLAAENVNISDEDDQEFSSLPDDINIIPNHHHHHRHHHELDRLKHEQQSVANTITTDSNQINNNNKSQSGSESISSSSQQVTTKEALVEVKQREPSNKLLDNNNSREIIEPTDAPHDTTTVEVDQLDDFYIDPKLINRSDGLKRSYFATDENGSPKILEEIIEREIERKNKKKEMVDSASDPDLFGCLGFSKLSKIFKNSRK